MRKTKKQKETLKKAKVFPPYVHAYWTTYGENSCSFQDFQEYLIGYANSWGEQSIGTQILERGSAMKDEDGYFILAVGYWGDAKFVALYCEKYIVVKTFDWDSECDVT